jgi:hypothetical protein
MQQHRVGALRARSVLVDDAHANRTLAQGNCGHETHGTRAYD